PTSPAHLSSIVGFSVAVPIGWSGFTWTFPQAASHRPKRNTEKSWTNRRSGFMVPPYSLLLGCWSLGAHATSFPLPREGELNASLRCRRDGQARPLLPSLVARHDDRHPPRSREDRLPLRLA